MQKAIIDIQTRVIKRLTIDDNPIVSSNEQIVEVKKEIDLAGGYWKLDDKDNKIQATQVEVELSKVDPDIEAQLRKDRYTQAKTQLEIIATQNNDVNVRLLANTLLDIL